MPQAGGLRSLISPSSLGRRLVETALFEIVDQGRINELGHIGAAEFRALVPPIPSTPDAP